MIKDTAKIKEGLLSLPEIDLGIIGTMTDGQLISYVQVLSVTANTYPIQKDELQHAFDEKDYLSVFQWLSIIDSSLAQLHAKKLAGELDKFLAVNNDMENIRNERIKVFINYLLPTLELFFKDVFRVLGDLGVYGAAMESAQADDSEDSETIKKKLSQIGELGSNTINNMNDEELSSYLRELSAFHIENKSLQNGLKGSIRIKNYSFVLQWLSTIEETLLRLHASQLAADCRVQIDQNKDFHNIRHEKLAVYIDYLLSTLSMLSEDIQKLDLPKHLAHKDEKPGATGRSMVIEYETLSPAKTPGAKSILVINKMKMFMNSLKSALSNFDNKIIGIKTAESTIGYLKTNRPDLFILDEELPGTDCFILIKIIRAIGHNAPIIITTSKITQDRMSKYVEAGVADFIMKPITAGDVQKRVKKHLP